MSLVLSLFPQAPGHPAREAAAAPGPGTARAPCGQGSSRLLPEAPSPSTARPHPIRLLRATYVP